MPGFSNLVHWSEDDELPCPITHQDFIPSQGRVPVEVAQFGRSGDVELLRAGQADHRQQAELEWKTTGGYEPIDALMLCP